jgi:hypothetical protein
VLVSEDGKQLPPPRYLGDGVYAMTDGYHLWLLTGSHDHPNNRVALEREVYENVKVYAKTMGWENE